MSDTPPQPAQSPPQQPPQPQQPPEQQAQPQPQTPPPPPPQPQAPAKPTGDEAQDADGDADGDTDEDQPRAIDARLNDSIKDAYTLLDFAARRALDIEPEVRAPIIASHRKLVRGQALSAQEETDFWKAFSEVIQELEPVTVESIVFTSPPNVADGWVSRLLSVFFSPKSQADKVLRLYHVISLITLMVLLALQVQWAIGMSIYNDAYKVHKNLIDSTEQFMSAQQTLEVMGNQNGTVATDAKLQADTLKRAQEREESWNEVSYLRLWWWNRGISSWVPPYDLQLSQPTNQPIPGSSFKLDTEGQRRVEFTRAELTLEVISNYFLVTLFALLGAMTQALRRLSIEIADVSLTRSSLYAIRTRIILGIISGVCMAWFAIISSSPPPADGATAASRSIPLEAISFMGAFTPWAMAFVSGYSVEIFFAALERLIEFITQRIKGDQPDARTTKIEQPDPLKSTPKAKKASPPQSSQQTPPNNTNPAHPQPTTGPPPT